MSDSRPFDELISLCRQGDAAALKELASTYEREVRMAARARIGRALQPYLDSVDLVQSVHRSLLIGLKANKFDISSPEKLVALTLTIVRRKAARHWRRVKRQQRLSGSYDPAAALGELLRHLSRRHDDPQDLAAQAELIEQLLRQLQEKDRQLIQLRLEGYTTVDAARRLGLDPDVTRVRLSRLRRRLTQLGIARDLL